MTHAAKTAWRLSLLLPCVFAPPESAKPFLRGGAIVGKEERRPLSASRIRSDLKVELFFIFLFLILNT